jgi:hypothetical protein
MLRLKQEYMNTTICCPATRQHIVCRFIDINLYEYYFNNGYSLIFEKITKNDISKPRNK